MAHDRFTYITPVQLQMPHIMCCQKNPIRPN